MIDPIMASVPVHCRYCGLEIPQGGQFCPRCGTPIGSARSRQTKEDLTEGLVLIVKAVIGLSGAALVSYGGWVLAVQIYQVLPNEARAFGQALAGLVIGILLIVLAFKFMDRIVKRSEPKARNK